MHGSASDLQRASLWIIYSTYIPLHTMHATHITRVSGMCLSSRHRRTNKSSGTERLALVWNLATTNLPGRIASLNSDIHK